MATKLKALPVHFAVPLLAVLAGSQTLQTSRVPHGDTLTSPAILENHAPEPNTVEVTLTAGATRLSLLSRVEPTCTRTTAPFPDPALKGIPISGLRHRRFPRRTR